MKRERKQEQRQDTGPALVAVQRRPISFNLGVAWVAAVVLLPVTVWLIVATVNDYGHDTAYRQAVPCSAAAGDTAVGTGPGTGPGTGTDCLSSRTAAVADTQDRGGDYTLTLEGDGITGRQIALPGTCQGADELSEAQEVQVRLWRGAVIEVSANGVTCDLSAAPGRAYAKALGDLLLVSPLCILCLLICAGSLVRMRFGPDPARRVGLCALWFLPVVFLCVGAGAGLDSSGQVDASAVYLGDGILLGLFAFALLAVLLRRRRETSRKLLR